MNSMDIPCESCGNPLGPEVFLSQHNVCGKCTRKRHFQVVGRWSRGIRISMLTYPIWEADHKQNNNPWYYQ